MLVIACALWACSRTLLDHDDRPELRASMRAGLAACISEPRDGEAKGLTSDES